MKDFSLITQLNENTNSTITPTNNIEYQQYELQVDGKDQVVNIPIRESVNFENTVTEMETPITRVVLKNLLRTFRGTRG